MPDEVDPLWGEYLAKRGLEEGDLPSFHVHPDPAVYRALGFSFSNCRGRHGRLIPYFRHDGEPYTRELDDGTAGPFGTIRYYESVEGAPKAVTPTGTKPELHFEPLRTGPYVGVSWAEIPEGATVVVCESRVKAAAIHKRTGLPCVGLSGITAFGSMKRGEDLIFKFYPLPWATWKMVLLPDNDYSDPKKSQVTAAVRTLAHRLKFDLKCRHVLISIIPFDGEKLGPDDYGMVVGSDGLFKVIVEAAPYVSDRYPGLVERMNRTAVYIRGLDAVGDIGDRNIRSMDKAQFCYAPIYEMGGEKGTKEVKGFDEWRKSENRQAVDTAGYRYGGEGIYQDGRDLTCFNTFRPGSVRGWGAIQAWQSRPRKKWRGEQWRNLKQMEASSWLQSYLAMVDGLTGGEHVKVGEHTARDLYLSYMKFLIATDKKPLVGVVLWSNERGIGKNVSMLPLHRVLGANFNSAMASDMIGDYTADFLNTRVVVVNEFNLNGPEKKGFLATYKTYLTERFMKCKQKYIPAYDVETSGGFLATCNAREDFPSDGIMDRRTLFLKGNPTGEAWNRWDARWKPLIDGVEDEGYVMEWLSWLLDDELVPWIDFSAYQPPMDEDREEDLVQGLSGWAQGFYALRQAVLKQFPDRWAWKMTSIMALTMEPTMGATFREYGLDEIKSRPHLAKALRDAGWIYSADVHKAPGFRHRGDQGKDDYYWSPLPMAELIQRGKHVTQKELGEMLRPPEKPAKY